MRPIFLGQAAAGPAHHRMSAARTPDNAFSLSEHYLINYSVKNLISEMNSRFGCASSRRRRTAVSRLEPVARLGPLLTLCCPS